MRHTDPQDPDIFATRLARKRRLSIGLVSLVLGLLAIGVGIWTAGIFALEPDPVDVNHGSQSWFLVAAGLALAGRGCYTLLRGERAEDDDELL